MLQPPPRCDDSSIRVGDFTLRETAGAHAAVGPGDPSAVSVLTGSAASTATAGHNPGGLAAITGP